jgi:DNA repair exonuclease SbcCD ATPase subunit
MADVPCYGGCPVEHTGAPDDQESRRWCHACSEWCYPGDPDMLCARGLELHLRAEVERLTQRVQLGADIIEAKDKDRASLSSEIEELNKELREAKRNAYPRHGQKLESEIERLREELREAEARKDNAEKAFAVREEQLGEAVAEVERLRAELAEAKRIIRADLAKEEA